MGYEKSGLGGDHGDRCYPLREDQLFIAASTGRVALVVSIGTLFKKAQEGEAALTLRPSNSERGTA